MIFLQYICAVIMIELSFHSIQQFIFNLFCKQLSKLNLENSKKRYHFFVNCKKNTSKKELWWPRSVVKIYYLLNNDQFISQLYLSSINQQGISPLYKINQMRNNLKISLLAFLLAYTSAIGSVGLGVVGPLTKSAFGCLSYYENAGQQFSWALVRIYKIRGGVGVDPAATQTLNNANSAPSPNTAVNAYQVSSYMQICRGQNAATQVNQAMSNTPQSLYNKVYIKVIPNDVVGCMWDGYSTVDNCNFVKAAINAVNSNKGYAAAGVFSTARIWEEFFGNDCNDIANMNPRPWLWYANYENNGHVNEGNSFDDFVPFGGYLPTMPNVPFLKQVLGNQTVSLCGSPTWTAYVDFTWCPFA